MEFIDPDDARAGGFETFNSGPHLCVDVPDGRCTVTCRTPSGQRVTFAFVPGTSASTHECVDVRYANAPMSPIDNGGTALHPFHMVGFTVGRTTFDTRDNAQPTTLATILLGDHHYAAPERAT